MSTEPNERDDELLAEASEADGEERSVERSASPSNEPDVVLTPRQILGGFVLLAALIALLLRRRGRDA